ncbi:hypothetical protein GE118_03910 [Mycoplasma sp. NEAQ87857]|uniref:hypothetical protein n=1 Tax=Mycoplasma sp. NEAQ87857 TaxID=2683967 RepID=UPI0013184F49|nr:hypothetical protein [Mycoplasma sp. NEAQ87857]QGZ97923.1 hypothetical protein GE118_03910 [Mycoplasma sp. NEAQ87857]
MDKYYKEKINKMIEQSRDALIKQIEEKGIEKWLDNKIDLYIERNVLPLEWKEQIIYELKNKNLFYLSVFTKDIKKQNIYENILLHFLKDNNIDAIKLPQAGKNALYAYNSIITNDISDKPLELKSLDFEINLNNNKIYLMHKYTEESGGAQDNQFNDVVNQIRNLDTNLINKVWFCLDGKYYTKQKINELKSLNKNIIIVNIHTILQTLKKFNK